MIKIVLQLQKSSDRLEFNQDSKEVAQGLIEWPDYLMISKNHKTQLCYISNG